MKSDHVSLNEVIYYHSTNLCYVDNSKPWLLSGAGFHWVMPIL